MSSPFRGSVSGKQGKEGKEKEGKGQASSKEREKGEGKGQASSRKREKDRHLPKKAEKKAEKRTGIFRGALALGGKQEKKRKKDRHFLPFFGVPGFGGRSYALSGSGLPTPRRRTFAAAILAFAHSELTSLRHPGSAGQLRRLSEHEQPLRDSVSAKEKGKAGKQGKEGKGQASSRKRGKRTGIFGGRGNGMDREKDRHFLGTGGKSRREKAGKGQALKAGTQSVNTTGVFGVRQAFLA